MAVELGLFREMPQVVWNAMRLAWVLGFPLCLRTLLVADLTGILLRQTVAGRSAITSSDSDFLFQSN